MGRMSFIRGLFLAVLPFAALNAACVGVNNFFCETSKAADHLFFSFSQTSSIACHLDTCVISLPPRPFEIARRYVAECVTLPNQGHSGESVRLTAISVIPTPKGAVDAAAVNVRFDFSDTCGSMLFHNRMLTFDCLSYNPLVSQPDKPFAVTLVIDTVHGRNEGRSSTISRRNKTDSSFDQDDRGDPDIQQFSEETPEHVASTGSTFSNMSTNPLLHTAQSSWLSESSEYQEYGSQEEQLTTDQIDDEGSYGFGSNQ